MKKIYKKHTLNRRINHKSIIKYLTYIKSVAQIKELVYNKYENRVENRVIEGDLS